jgi:hypothetical protein
MYLIDIFKSDVGIVLIKFLFLGILHNISTMKITVLCKYSCGDTIKITLI